MIPCGLPSDPSTFASIAFLIGLFQNGALEVYFYIILYRKFVFVKMIWMEHIIFKWLRLT